MKIIKTASGKQIVKISKTEWESIGQEHGWMKVAAKGMENLPSEKFDELTGLYRTLSVNQDKAMRLVRDIGQMARRSKNEYISKVCGEIISRGMIGSSALGKLMEALEPTPDPEWATYKTPEEEQMSRPSRF